MFWWFLSFNTNRSFIHARSTPRMQPTHTLASHTLKPTHWQKHPQNSSASEGLQPILLQDLILLLIVKYWTIITLIFSHGFFSCPAISTTGTLLQPVLTTMSNWFRQMILGSVNTSESQHLHIALLTLNLSETPSVMLIVNSAILGVRNFPFLRSGSYSVFVLTTTFKKKN